MAKTLSSQRLEWLFVCVTIGLCSLMIAFGRGHEPRVGDTRALSVSVVPADKRNLACAHKESIAGLSCAFSTIERNARSRKLDERDRLAPYVTTNGELVVLAGVFAGDQMAQAVQKKRRSRKDRFNVNCQVKLVAYVAQIPIRFSPRDDFKPADLTWIGRATECVPEL